MKLMPVNFDMLNEYGNYTSPLVIACAVSVVVLFAEYVKMPVWLGRIAGFMGPSMFGVYLIHDVTKFGKFYVPVQKWLVAAYDPHPLVVLFTAATTTFAVCLAIDLARRAVFGGVKQVLGMLVVQRGGGARGLSAAEM